MEQEGQVDQEVVQAQMKQSLALLRIQTKEVQEGLAKQVGPLVEESARLSECCREASEQRGQAIEKSLVYQNQVIRDCQRMQDTFMQLETLNQKVALFKQLASMKLNAKAAYLKQLQEYGRSV